MALAWNIAPMLLDSYWMHAPVASAFGLHAEAVASTVHPTFKAIPQNAIKGGADGNLALKDMMQPRCCIVSGRHPPYRWPIMLRRPAFLCTSVTAMDAFNASLSCVMVSP